MEGRGKILKSPPLASTSPEGCVHTPAEQKVARVTTHTAQGEVEGLKGYNPLLKKRSCPLAVLCLSGKKRGRKNTPNKQSGTSFATLPSRTPCGMRARAKITASQVWHCGGEFLAGTTMVASSLPPCSLTATAQLASTPMGLAPARCPFSLT